DDVECLGAEGTYRKKHYATKDMYEYFSEGLAAFFTKHYCFPHNKIDLKKIDLKLYDFIQKRWE
ncbi:MAG: hypothetical protein HQK51_00995, partial [Oligoflexia bacterium]|nr:hypothetical protein [Oligoflexia bacterium]